jgi:hypothetical protein
MVKQQQTMILSPYAGIYDLVVPKDNISKVCIRKTIVFQRPRLSFVYLMYIYLINNLYSVNIFDIVL